MNHHPDPPASYRFGVFELVGDPSELRKQGRRVKLRPQSLKLLHLLVERPSDTITREAIQRRLMGRGRLRRRRAGRQPLHQGTPHRAAGRCRRAALHSNHPAAGLSVHRPGRAGQPFVVGTDGSGGGEPGGTVTLDTVDTRTSTGQPAIVRVLELECTDGAPCRGSAVRDRDARSDDSCDRGHAAPGDCGTSVYGRESVECAAVPRCLVCRRGDRAHRSRGHDSSPPDLCRRPLRITATRTVGGVGGSRRRLRSDWRDCAGRSGPSHHPGRHPLARQLGCLDRLGHRTGRRARTPRINRGRSGDCRAQPAGALTGSNAAGPSS